VTDAHGKRAIGESVGDAMRLIAHSASTGNGTFRDVARRRPGMGRAFWLQ